jgi:hypothetical protein
MNDKTMAIVCVFYFALIALTCYMVVNHGFWWILLLLFTSLKVSYKSKGSNEDE